MIKRRSYLPQQLKNHIKRQQSILPNSNQQYFQQNSQKFSLYDICHHCKHVISSGTLLQHLKSSCLPRKIKISKLNLLQNNPQQSIEQVKNQKIIDKFGSGMNQLKHKIYSPWTQCIRKEIRDHMKPTRSRIIEKYENF